MKKQNKGLTTKKQRKESVKKRGKVLVVEDNTTWSNRLKEILSENGFRVIVIKTKDEALKILERENFHFATFDLQLDEETLDVNKFEGWEVMKKVLAIGANRTMPIMVLTGFPGDEDNDNAKKAFRDYKATFFMEKSKFDKKEFVNTVIKSVEGLNVRFKDDYKS